MSKDIISKVLVLGIHRNSSKPPLLPSLGNPETRASLNSSQEQLMLGMKTFFSPKPADTKTSRSREVVGTLRAFLLLRQNTFRVQLWGLRWVFD